jgi:hypothetical protein
MKARSNHLVTLVQRERALIALDQYFKTEVGKPIHARAGAARTTIMKGA